MARVCKRSAVVMGLVLVICAVGPLVAGVAVGAGAGEYILLQAESFEGLGIDPAKEWVVSYNLYGDVKVAVAADWTVKGVAISKTIELPRGGEYAVWARHYNLKGDRENYRLNFLVAIMQDGEILLEHEFAKVSKGGWAVWLWDRADQTVVLKPGQVTILIVAGDGAQGIRGVDAVLLSPDLSMDPNREQIPL